MHTKSISFICLCLATTTLVVVNGQYQKSSPYSQRKMAPVPSSYLTSGSNDYSASNQGYQQQQQQQQQQQGYGGQQQQSYSAPSSASVSRYDESQQAASSYGSGSKSHNYAANQGSSAYGGANGGYGKQQQKYEEPQHPPMPFAWGYDINDGYGGAQYHKENGDEYGKRTGSYGYTDAYGIYRQVDYVADEYGFRATIKTNEPGTANESPADVDLHAYEPPSNYYAGNTQSYSGGSSSYSAPASYSAPSASYSAPKQSAPRQSYQAAPKMGGYQQRQRQSASQYPPASSMYQNRQQSNYGSSQQYPQQQQQQQQEYSSSSVLVPVYQKASSSPVVQAATNNKASLYI